MLLVGVGVLELDGGTVGVVVVVGENEPVVVLVEVDGG